MGTIAFRQRESEGWDTASRSRLRWLRTVEARQTQPQPRPDEAESAACGNMGGLAPLVAFGACSVRWISLAASRHVLAVKGRRGSRRVHAADPSAHQELHSSTASDGAAGLVEAKAPVGPAAACLRAREDGGGDRQRWLRLRHVVLADAPGLHFSALVDVGSDPAWLLIAIVDQTSGFRGCCWAFRSSVFRLPHEQQPTYDDLLRLDRAAGEPRDLRAALFGCSEDVSVHLRLSTPDGAPSRKANAASERADQPADF